ncbi:transposase [Colwellia sp. MB3u-70]|nr:transposase [Colwellia sp. MB3u-8]MBA6308901.1 transposase [Colwellia sp. MB3u-70]
MAEQGLASGCAVILPALGYQEKVGNDGLWQGSYQLKTAYRDGTTHVIFEPLDFIARLAVLVPKPSVNLTRFHGVFALNRRHRVTITRAKRNKAKQALTTGRGEHGHKNIIDDLGAKT